MGKNRDRESLIRLMVNTIVHELVLKNTNRPESKHFIDAEIIEYGGQTEKMAESHSWNQYDKKYLREKLLKNIKEKIKNKYLDVTFSIKDVEKLVDNKINELF